MQTEDYKEVREWARQVMDNPGYTSPFMQTVAKTMLELLPSQTIADTGFDFDEHHLAGATTRDGDEVVMLWQDVDETEQIICDDSAWAPDCLAPNGKQYELREISEPDHPETLTTAEDYADAPVGTIAAPNQCSPYMKYGLIRWKDMSDDTFSDEDMSGAALKVLRWGWGA